MRPRPAMPTDDRPPARLADLAARRRARPTCSAHAVAAALPAAARPGLGGRDRRRPGRHRRVHRGLRRCRRRRRRTAWSSPPAGPGRPPWPPASSWPPRGPTSTAWSAGTWAPARPPSRRRTSPSPRSGMAYGGITPVGLPADWPVLVDPAVAAADFVVIGSGTRGSKLAVPGAAARRAAGRRGARRARASRCPSRRAAAGAAPGAARAPGRQRRRLGRAARASPPTTTGATWRTGRRTGAATERSEPPGRRGRARAGRVGAGRHALLGAQQVADLDQQLDLGRRRRAGLLAAPAPLDELFIGTTTTK